MEKRIEFYNTGQELISITVELEKKEKLARIIRVRDEALTPVYYNRYARVKTMKEGGLLGIVNPHIKATELIKFPIEKIVELPDRKPVICFSLRQAQKVVTSLYVDDNEKPGDYIKESDLPVVIYDKYRDCEWSWDRETAYNEGIHGKYMSFEEFSKQFNNK